MKNLKTTMLTAIFVLCCYANVKAQAIEGKTKDKVVSAETAAINVAKTNTATFDAQLPQQTARGIKDPGVKACGNCGLTGKAQAGRNPQATAKNTARAGSTNKL